MSKSKSNKSKNNRQVTTVRVAEKQINPIMVDLNKINATLTETTTDVQSIIDEIQVDINDIRDAIQTLNPSESEQPTDTDEQDKPQPTDDTDKKKSDKKKKIDDDEKAEDEKAEDEKAPSTIFERIAFIEGGTKSILSICTSMSELIKENIENLAITKGADEKTKMKLSLNPLTNIKKGSKLVGGFIKNIMGKLSKLFTGVLGKFFAVSAIIGFFLSPPGLMLLMIIGAFFKNYIMPFITPLINTYKKFGELWGTVWSDTKIRVINAWKSIKDKLSDFSVKMSSIWDKIKGIGGIIAAVPRVIASNLLNPIIGGLNYLIPKRWEINEFPPPRLSPEATAVFAGVSSAIASKIPESIKESSIGKSIGGGIMSSVNLEAGYDGLLDKKANLRSTFKSQMIMLRSAQSKQERESISRAAMVTADKLSAIDKQLQIVGDSIHIQNENTIAPVNIAMPQQGPMESPVMVG